MVARNGGKLNASSSLLLLAGMSRGVLQEANDDDTMAENAFSRESRLLGGQNGNESGNTEKILAHCFDKRKLAKKNTAKM